MDLLKSNWIPTRANHGAGAFRLLTLEELLCAEGDWRVSLPRDDLELACIQLLVSMAQVMFLPEDPARLRQLAGTPLKPEQLADATKPFADWFDLAHPSQPFMQTRCVKAAEDTPIQKLLIGLPEGNNHAFFNEVGEVARLGAPVAAIALFNQAVNSPSFGGGFKGGLRGGAPITTLVSGPNLRATLWRNVVTLPNILSYLPGYLPDFAKDRPTWVDPIREKQTFHAHDIGLARGLFWQPAHVELVSADAEAPCDVLGGEPGPSYAGFRKEKFNFTVEGIWPHPHGARLMLKKAGALEEKFASFTTTAPGWTHLTAFVVPQPMIEGAAEGSSPAAPVHYASVNFPGQRLHLLVGGYRTKQASVLERRHEFFNLAEGWEEEGRDRVRQLVQLGLDVKKILRGRLYYAVQGDSKKGMKGLGVPLHETGDKLFYAQTETYFHETLREKLSFKEWKAGKAEFTRRLADTCKAIYEDLTAPYTHKPELIPIIAWAGRSLNSELAKLTEGT